MKLRCMPVTIHSYLRRFTVRVPVACHSTDSDSFSASVKPMHINYVKKNVLVPNCVVSIDGE